MRVFLWICSIAAIVGGAGIVVTSLPDAAWGRLDPSPLAGGVALGAVGITSAIALVTTASFNRQRAQATESLLREQRAAVYRDLLAGMMRAFGPEASRPDVANERATVAMWASTESMDAFEKWFSYAWMNRGTIPEKEKPHMYNLFGNCVEAMRRDLGMAIDQSSRARHTLLQMIFVDYASDMKSAAAAALKRTPDLNHSEPPSDLP